jgi:hypothetical protein
MKDTLEQPLAHPGSEQETFFTNACMQEYAAALQRQELPPAPLVESEAAEGCQVIAKQAAISRLCMIQDAHNFWDDRDQEMQ